MIIDLLHNRSFLNFTQLSLFDLSSIIQVIGEEWYEMKKSCTSIKNDGDEYKKWIERFFPDLSSFSRLSYSKKYLLFEHRPVLEDNLKDRIYSGKPIRGGFWTSPKYTREMKLIPKALLKRYEIELLERKDTIIEKESLERTILRSVKEKIPKLMGIFLYQHPLNTITFGSNIGLPASFYPVATGRIKYPKKILHTYDFPGSFEAMTVFYLHYLQKKYYDISKNEYNQEA